ncbi:MAG: hypothetical protein ABIQ18_32020 [Umezawaea sp.]
MASTEWSEKKQNDVGFRLAAGLVNTAIKHAHRNPQDQDAQDLANELSDQLAQYRREAAREV